MGRERAAGLRGSAAPPRAQGRSGHRPPLRRDGRPALPGPAAAAVPDRHHLRGLRRPRGGERAVALARLGRPSTASRGGRRRRAPRGASTPRSEPAPCAISSTSWASAPGPRSRWTARRRPTRHELWLPLFWIFVGGEALGWPFARTSTTIERSIRQLQIEWDKFFSGVEKKPPNDLKAKVEALDPPARQREIRNNTERFRYQTLTARYNTLNELWSKRLRAREEGKAFGVHGLKAEILPPPPPPLATARAPRAARRATATRSGWRAPSATPAPCAPSTTASWRRARRNGESAPVKFESFQKLIAQQASRILTEKGGQAVDFRLETKDGKVSLEGQGRQVKQGEARPHPHGSPSPCRAAPAQAWTSPSWRRSNATPAGSFRARCAGSWRERETQVLEEMQRVSPRGVAGHGRRPRARPAPARDPGRPRRGGACRRRPAPGAAGQRGPRPPGRPHAHPRRPLRPGALRRAPRAIPAGVAREYYAFVEANLAQDPGRARRSRGPAARPQGTCPTTGRGSSTGAATSRPVIRAELFHGRPRGGPPRARLPLAGLRRGLALLLAGGHRHRRHLARGLARRPAATSPACAEAPRGGAPRCPARPVRSSPREGPMTMSVKRALLSVYRKDGIVELAQGARRARLRDRLHRRHRRRAQEGRGRRSSGVSKATGFPEILDGRVKTLHPEDPRRDPGPARRAEPTRRRWPSTASPPIDVVVVNLYPFEDKVAKGAPFDEAVENIDIGGPAMLRAAAKNFQRRRGGGGPRRLRAAPRAARPRGRHRRRHPALLRPEGVPPHRALRGGHRRLLRPGRGEGRRLRGGRVRRRLPLPAEPHLREGPGPALRREPASAGGVLQRPRLDPVLGGRRPQGAGQGALVQQHPRPRRGLARSSPRSTSPPASSSSTRTPAAPASARVRSRPTSGPGTAIPSRPSAGIVAFNRQVDAATAKKIAAVFVEAVIAPGFEPEAKKALARRRTCGSWTWTRPASTRSRASTCGASWAGCSPRSGTCTGSTRDKCEVVTKRKPTDDEWKALLLAWTVVKHVKSNAIVYANAVQTVGVGAGQMSRVDAARFAALKAQLPLTGTVAASDAFFPFRDGVDEIAQAGATAVIQPGRLGEGRGGDRRRRRARPGHGLHGRAALPALRRLARSVRARRGRVSGSGRAPASRTASSSPR